MLVRLCLVALVFPFLAIVPGTPCRSAERVDVVVDPSAPELERFAAQELAAQFGRLFDVETRVATPADEAGATRILVGRPESNASVKAVAANDWPKLSEQGIVLRSYRAKDHHGLIVGGGSPVATLWAVYELGYRFGIRYLLREDIYPDTPLPLKLDDVNVVMEPELPTREWESDYGSPISPASWPLADHKRLLGQLAKLKFNRVLLSLHPWQPFVHYEFQGVKKETAVLWHGEKLAIARDAPGRTALGGDTVFENPDFAGKTTYAELTAAAIDHVRGVIDEAHRLGMSVALSISPLEFPGAFAKLDGAEKSSDLTAVPGGASRPDDPTIRGLAAANLRAYLETYPTIDALVLPLPRISGWESRVESGWRELADRIGDDAPPLKTLLLSELERPQSISGEGRVHKLRGQIVALAFLNSLLDDSTLRKRPDGRPVELEIRSADPELFPYLDRILPRGATALIGIDRTASGGVERKAYFRRIPADRVRSRLILPLSSGRVGLLPQSATRQLETLIGKIRKHSWNGFSTSSLMLAELDPSVHYLSRAAWDANVSVRAAHDELFTTITGKQAVSDRLWLAFGHIEQASELIDRNDAGFAYPTAGLLLKHSLGAPKWWDEVVEHYTQAMTEVYRGRDSAAPRSQPLLFYYAKRGEYVLDYLNCVKAVRAAAIARAAGDTEKAATQFESAVESLYNAIDTLSDVALDQSDRGLIAVLISYAYQPLVAEAEKFASEN